MPDHSDIYNNYAEQYEALVAREDYQQNILPALQNILALQNITVAEFGAGTGRLTCLLAPLVRHIYAFDRSAHMLEVACAKLQHNLRHNWQVAVAEHQKIGLEDGMAELAISGWSICYLVVENAEWKTKLARALQEMMRVVKSRGTLILIETLGTGVETPLAPADLIPYYQYLEADGFQREWIRTDYLFASTTEGEHLARFFFGDDMVTKLQEDERGAVLPECTGIWWKRKTG